MSAMEGGEAGQVQTYFGKGVKIDEARKPNAELSCGILFYIAMLAQVVIAFIIIASKNSEMPKIRTDSQGQLQVSCPGSYVLARTCAGPNRQFFSSGLGDCISKDLCKEVASCTTVRRLQEDNEPSWQQHMGVAATIDHLRRLASEDGPESHDRMHTRHRAARLLAGGKDIPNGVWEFLESHWYQPLVLFASATILGVLWLAALAKASKIVIWCTIAADILMLIAVFFYYMIEIDINWAPLIAAVVVLIGAGIFFRQINHTAVIMQTAMGGLTENMRIFAVCLGLQLLWICFFAIWLAGVMAMHFSLEVQTSWPDQQPYEMDSCRLGMKSWIGSPGLWTFYVLAYYWVTYFFRNTNLMMITCNLSGWYFGQEGSRSLWVQGITWAFGVQSGANAMASAIMGFSEYLLNRIGSVWNLIFSFMLPWNWILLCIALVAKVFLQTFTKFGLIAATISARPFCEAAPKGLVMLKSKLGEAVLADYLGSRVMSWATYMIALGVGFAAWAWADVVQGVNLFKSIPGEAVIGVIIMYAYLLSYPFVALIIVIMMESMIGGLFEGEVRAVMNSVFASLFMASITVYILMAVSKIVINSMDVIFFCFAIEEEMKAEKQERFNDMYESIKTTIISGDVKNNSNATIGQPVAGQPAQAVPAQPADQPTVVGTAVSQPEGAGNNNV